MFQFPQCPHMHSHVYRCCQQWVAPFGYPWITRYQLVPRAFRSVVASFIGSLRLGIHHAPIFVDFPTVQSPLRASTLRYQPGD